MRTLRILSPALVLTWLPASSIASAAQEPTPDQVEEVREHAGELFEALDEMERRQSGDDGSADAAPEPDPPDEPDDVDAPPTASPPQRNDIDAPSVPEGAHPSASATDPEAADDIRAFVEMVQTKRRLHRHHHHYVPARDELGHVIPGGDEAIAVVVATKDSDDDDGSFEPRRFRIGIEGHGATGPVIDGRFDVIGSFGLDLGLRLAPFLTVGVGQIGPARIATARHARWGANAAPYAELDLRINRVVQLYAQGGVVLQMRRERDSVDIGAAPYGGAGLRLFIANRVSVGPTFRAYWLLTPGYVVSDMALPAGAIVLAGGLDVHVHF